MGTTIEIPAHLTKADEIRLLRLVASAFGSNTYCGPWLSSVADAVESDIRSDFPPVPQISLTRKEAEQLIGNAKAEASEIIARAGREAEALKASARQQAERTLETARRRIRDALAAIP